MITVKILSGLIQQWSIYTARSMYMQLDHKSLAILITKFKYVI